MNNNKGFTLIELIAVVVILGIIAIITVPNVNSYIIESRKDAFAEVGKNYISSVRTSLSSKDYYVNGNKNLTCKLPTAGKYTAIRIDKIATESDIEQSPFKRSLEVSGSSSRGYVIAVNVSLLTGKDYDIVYYFAAIDAGGNGIDQFVSESDLSGDVVKRSNANQDRTSNYKKNLLSTTSPITIKTGAYNGKTFQFYQECGGIIDG